MRVGFVRGTVAAFAGALLLAGAGVAWAEAVTWDQARVTALAQELDEAVSDLKMVVRKNPDQPIGQARRAQYEARDDLRVMQALSGQLHRDLADGAGREETISTFRRIQQTRRDLEELARRANVQNDTMDKAMATQDVLRRMAPYYETAESGGEM